MGGNSGQAEPLHGGLGQQNPLGQRHVRGDPGTARGQAAASDGDPAGADRTVFGGPLPEVSRADQPVSSRRPPESLSRTQIDFLQQDQAWFELMKQLALPPSSGDTPCN